MCRRNIILHSSLPRKYNYEFKSALRWFFSFFNHCPKIICCYVKSKCAKEKSASCHEIYIGCGRKYICLLLSRWPFLIWKILFFIYDYFVKGNILNILFRFTATQITYLSFRPWSLLKLKKKSLQKMTLRPRLASALIQMKMTLVRWP